MRFEEKESFFFGKSRYFARQTLNLAETFIALANTGKDFLVWPVPEASEVRRGRCASGDGKQGVVLGRGLPGVGIPVRANRSAIRPLLGAACSPDD